MPTKTGHYSAAKAPPTTRAPSQSKGGGKTGGKIGSQPNLAKHAGGPSGKLPKAK